jgi:hypothetical protein
MTGSIDRSVACATAGTPAGEAAPDVVDALGAALVVVVVVPDELDEHAAKVTAAHAVRARANRRMGGDPIAAPQQAGRVGCRASTPKVP